jgi:phosphoglycolate phosphatase-like HAD superfamily hydrolase
MQQAILFDLDDTLIDTRQRHYHVFSDFFKSKNLPGINFEEYISQRQKNSLSNRALLQKLFSGYDDDFDNFFANAIENADYLKYDQPIINNKLLEKIKSKDIKMFILSLRSKEQNAMQQVQQFSFYKLIDAFIFFKHKQGFNQKAEHITYLKSANNIKAFIGDNDYDKEAATLSDVAFCAVKTGMYQINHPAIFDDVNEALQEILK